MRRRLHRYALAPLALMLAMLIAACGGAATPPEQGAGAQTQPTTAAEQPTAAPAQPTTAAEQPTAAPAQPTTAAEQPTTPPNQPNQGERNPDYLEFGVVAHLYYTDRERVMQLTQNAGFDWVRQQIYWRDIEDPVNGILAWDEVDRIVEATNAYGRKLLVNVVRSPTAYNASNGLPDDPATFANFMGLLAERYKGRIHAYEVWNEPNLAHETGGTIRPEDVGRYVEMLKLAYTTIKAIDPDAIVLAAASSSSAVTNPSIALADEEFYRLMYTYNDGEVRNYFDVQAVHPGGAANPPDTLWPDSPSFIEGCLPAPDRCWNDDETHYFRHIENVRRWMEQYGMGDKEVWITEYGWATENNTPGFEFGNFVSREQQAEYITGAIRRTFEEYPYVGNMFLWNMNFAVTKAENGLDPNHEQASFGLLNPDWSPRPSYLAVQSLIAELKQRQGR
jgi:polysaccharide biosynthesis protein PslG